MVLTPVAGIDTDTLLSCPPSAARVTVPATVPVSCVRAGVGTVKRARAARDVTRAHELRRIPGILLFSDEWDAAPPIGGPQLQGLRQRGGGTRVYVIGGAAKSVPPDGPGSGRSGVYDQCGHHSEHPMLRLRVRKDVAMERPGARVGGLDQDIPALSRSDVERVALPRHRLVPSVLRDDGHVHAVEMHGVDHHAFV